MELEENLLKINLLDLVNYIRNKLKNIKRDDIKVYLTIDKDKYSINFKTNKPSNHIFKYVIDNDVEKMIFLDGKIEDLYLRIIHAYDLYLFRKNNKR